MIKQERLVLVIGGQESQNYSSKVIRLGPTQIRWFLWRPGETQDRLPRGHSRAVFSQAKAMGDYQARVLLDQTALIIVRREAGPVSWWPKTLKRELEKQLLATKGPYRKDAEWQPKNKSLLSLSRGKMKKGDVEVDCVDEWEPIRLPEAHATAIQGTEELCHRTQF